MAEDDRAARRRRAASSPRPRRCRRRSGSKYMFWAATSTSLPAQRLDDGGQREVGRADDDLGSRSLDLRQQRARRTRAPRRSSCSSSSSPRSPASVRSSSSLLLAPSSSAAPPPRAAPCPRSARARRRRRSRASRRRSPSPNWTSAAPESPPPTIVVASVLATASATVRVAGRERLELEGAHRAVPEDGAGGRDPLGVGGGGRRADVEAHHPLGDVDTVELTAARRRRRSSRRSRGRWAGAASQSRALGAARAPRGASSTPSSSTSEFAGLVALGAEEAEAHRAADQDRVGEVEEAVDDADLVGHLGAAEDDDERPRRVVEHRGQLVAARARAGGRRRRAAGGRRPRWRRGRGGRRRRRR